MLILSLLVLRALSGSFCYDVELEGNVKIGKHFMNALREPSELVAILRKYVSSNIEGKGKLPKALEPMVMRMRASNKTTTEKIGNNRRNKAGPLEQLVKHLQSKGRTSFNNIGTKIMTDLNIKKNIAPILKIITNDYVVLMQNYYDFVKKNQYESDRELLYLDVVETSSKLLFNEAKKLLNDIIMHENHTAQTGSFRNMTDKLLELNYEDKKEAMKYICDNYNICRQYPAFTDFFANLMSEVLILDDTKFSAILEILTKILKQNEKIFARISEKEDRKLIIEKLQDFPNELHDAKYFLFGVRSLLTERYKNVLSDDAELKMRSKATRIILDILDKALTREDEILAIDFDNTVHVIKNWSILGRNEIDRHLMEFAKSLLRKLQHNLTKNAREELKVLIQTIMRGKPEHNELYKRLFKHGSIYVKNEDFHSDVELF